jgi:hypothetical protein
MDIPAAAAICSLVGFQGVGVVNGIRVCSEAT